MSGGGGGSGAVRQGEDAFGAMFLFAEHAMQISHPCIHRRASREQNETPGPHLGDVRARDVQDAGRIGPQPPVAIIAMGDQYTSGSW